MLTPQKNAPQGAKQSTRQSKSREENQKSVQSDNDAYSNPPQDGDKTPSRKTRKQRKPSNPRRNGVQSDVGEFQEREGGQRYPSQSGKHKNTPAKAIRNDAYAGPTFHQSPAASVIPMPSFMPRSLPIATHISTIAETTDGSSDIRQTDAGKELKEERRDLTPLDWMFDAARQARAPPNGANTARMLSPPNQSPAPSPGPRKDETDFPFELEGVDENKSVYSTPFSQRLAATKTPHSTSEGGQTLTEDERRAKTAALKKALMKSTPSPQLGSPFDDNPFNARNAPPNSYSPRHTSNPGTPNHQDGYASGPNNQYFTYNPTSPSRNFSAYPTNRPPSSNLRNVYDPTAGTFPISPPSTAPQERVSSAQSPPPRPQLNLGGQFGSNFGAIYGQPVRPSSEGNPIGHNPKPSLEQGLDDLKKVLNLTNLGHT